MNLRAADMSVVHPLGRHLMKDTHELFNEIYINSSKDVYIVLSLMRKRDVHHKYLHSVHTQPLSKGFQ